jgi:hypothetical protein
MKQIFFTLTAFLCLSTAEAQITNGSFETGSNADLSHWEWTCLAESDSNAPFGGGNWSIKVFSGNTQGCFPGYAYQKLPAISDGQTYILYAWGYAETSAQIGLHFGKINNGIITLHDGDSTSSTSWTQLNIQSSFSLSSGDTALVILDAGLVGGPAQGYGYFDSVNLQLVSGINSLEPSENILFYPNPFCSQTTLHTDFHLQNATLSITDIFGQQVKQIKNLSGKTFVLERDNLSPGIYLVKLIENNTVIATKKITISGY